MRCEYCDYSSDMPSEYRDSLADLVPQRKMLVLHNPLVNKYLCTDCAHATINISRHYGEPWGLITDTWD
jgi:hypothetical protein